MIVLDTDVLIEIFDRQSARGDEALRKLIERGEAVATTVINLHEFYMLLKSMRSLLGMFCSYQ
ncbi:MAG: PIN domain-containing protein [Candidatus Bathyarchaeia archaeon]